jgi:hypothetical protein
MTKFQKAMDLLASAIEQIEGLVGGDESKNLNYLKKEEKKLARAKVDKSKIFVIIYGNDDDNARDIYCAADSQELADKILADDIAKGDLQEGAFVTEVNYFSEN